MKHVISKEYARIASQKVMKEMVVSLQNDFEDNKQNYQIESMPERIQVAIKAKDRSTHFQSQIQQNILYITSL